ncbi:hypothetical protein HAZT_HAZT010647 [Hyalella azteca]|uniref:Reverse transcriptase domain-containing protein n=1 Tax=Hyalella azteca TaxID=294128 RepID=A0A6A0H6J5_HYAAZ|nr:hypothetical protein HAZT_HAZT010647 [Hyalella azteca]
MDKDTLTIVRKKHKLFRRWQETRDGQDCQAYKKERNKARKDCRNAQKQLEKKIADEINNQHKGDLAVRKIQTKSRSGVADLIQEDGRKTENDQEKANLLNDFFQSVFTQEVGDTIPEPAEALFEKELLNFEVTLDKVRKQFAGLHVGKASGPDGIPSIVLATAADELAEPVPYLFRLSIEKGQIPAVWKKAAVTPVFKTANNYRPTTRNGIDNLQRDFDHLQAWSNRWLLKFHPEKCSVIKLGWQKSQGTYYMNEQDGRLELAEGEVERDLGVIIDNKLSFKEHVAQCTANAN